MHHPLLGSARAIARAATVLGIVAAAAFVFFDAAGNAGAQTASGTPVATGNTTPAATAATSASTSSTASNSTAAFAVGQAVVVNVDTLNFRADASIDAAVQAQLLDGTMATIVSGPVDTSDGYSWWQINVDGNTGWVDGAYLADAATEASDMPVGTTVIVATDTLNLRSDPTLSGAVLSTMSNGDTASVVGSPQTADGYTWLQIDANGVTGWVARDFLAFEPSDISTVTTGGSALVNTDVLVLRDSASTSGAKLADLTGGTTVTVVSGPTAGADGDWYQVSDGTTTGWVEADYLRVV